MKQRTLLSVAEDAKGGVKVTCPNMDEAVMAITDHLLKTCKTGDRTALDVLFSVTVHLLAMDRSGRFEEQYIENIRKTVPAYRKGYVEMAEEMRKKMN